MRSLSPSRTKTAADVRRRAEMAEWVLAAEEPAAFGDGQRGEGWLLPVVQDERLKVLSCA